MRAPFISGFSLLASGALILVSTAARAADCSADSDCPKSYTCQVVGSSGGCAAPACPPGEPCAQPDCIVEQDIMGCVPSPCTTDSDCADGMVCYSQTETACPVSNQPSCPPDSNCATPAETCTSKTVSACVPKYVLPCTNDAACGDGFTCVPDECACAGGSAIDAGPAPSAGGDSPSSSPPAPSGSGNTTPPPAPGGSADAMAPLPPSCTCTSQTSHCQATNTPCTATSQCPAGWLCEQDPSATTGIGGCAARMLPDGGFASDCGSVVTPPVQLVCVPPYSNLGYTYGNGTLSDASGTFSGGAGAPEGVTPTGGTSTGSAGGGNDLSATPSATSKSASKDSGGCEIGVGHAHSNGAALLGLLGLLGLARRRRADG